MAARKLNQEVEKCFKKVNEGIAEFDEIYEKIEQSSNQAQKEKLEDNLKREIKKLQRMRDQIKTWTQSNDIKDKTMLMDYRRLIESRMEQFKAVEKLMKTKAFSKEGLSAQAALDPREKAKSDCSDFLGNQIELLEQQKEALEAEREAMGSVKKGKKSKENAIRVIEIEAIIEKHKWHQGKLELIRRALVNDSVEPDDVNGLKDSIEYYINEGQSPDYADDEAMYDDLELEEEEDAFGMVQDNDKGSSQDTQSLVDETPEAAEVRSSSAVAKGKERAAVDAPATATTSRKSASQLKSPLPTLATLHTPPLNTIGSGPAAILGMKPAAAPIRPPGDLKYASAAAAAADKNNVGIAPLPPPATANPAVSAAASQSKPSSTSSPSLSSAQLASSSQPAEPKPAAAPTPVPAARSATSSAPPPPTPKPEVLRPTASRAAAKASATPAGSADPPMPHTNGVSNGVKAAKPAEDESVYHLPPSLGDLIECWEVAKTTAQAPTNPATQRLIAVSRDNCPELLDAEPIKIHHPENYWDTSVTWPREPLSLIDNPALYSPAKVDNDTLFYAFYYRQGSYQQYLAAKALKDQAWRFHKQYQTWFQRHEEPKNITEEFEQGTYRFFDYESTWMNRRKAEFKFAYKFLEDDI